MSQNLRLVGATEDLESTRVRGMAEVAREAREREGVAVRGGRVADAAMYAEVAARAEEVAARERELRYARRTVTGDEATRARAAVDRRALGARLGAAALAGLVLFAVLLLATGCTSTMPAVRGPGAGTTLEAYVGSAEVSGRGHEDVADAGPYGLLGASGAFKVDREGVATEWFAEGGRIDARDVNAGDLGLFDLEADLFRFGLGLRSDPVRSLGLDWQVGLGACLTIVQGDASAGAQGRSVKESGLGAYAAGTVSRGPLFVRCTYVDGPEVEVADEDVELGGLTVVGGLRWTF